MDRRDFLRAGAALGTAGLAGCLGVFETRSADSAQFTTVEDRDQAVYYPTHIDGMEMLGMGGTGPYKAGLMYSTPHAFWTITGTDKNLARAGDTSAHFMATIWHAETETVLPTANVSAEIRKDGEEVDSRSLWPMLSQNMGYHFGDNVDLDGDGTYTAVLDVGGIQARRMGALADLDGDGWSVEVSFDHSREKLGNVSYEQLPDKQGTAGAIAPMEMMMMPISRVPERGDLPGVVGTGTSGDADVVAFVPDESPGFLEDGRDYLAVSARTPYNRYPLPFMSLSATLERGNTSVFDDVLEPAIDPDLGYHYGAGVDGIESGDALTVGVDSPPQVARHEGYETAFVDMPAVELTV